MTGYLTTIHRDLFQPRCLDCGYDGDLLHGGAADRCVKCGCDFRIRPPRSYAEMEGLTAPLVVDRAPRAGHVWRERRRRSVHRWLAFLTLLMFGVLLFLYLADSAMP